MPKPLNPNRFVSLGFTAIDWIEHYLIHGPGDVQGQAIEIDDEMAKFIVNAYQLDPVTGKRRINRAFLSRPKGRAKSEIAGAIACFEALGPCRFEGWDANGDPVGKRQTYPFIRCLATEEGQAGNSYDNITVMLSHLSTEFGDEFPRIDLGRSAQTSSRIFFEGGGEIVPSTSSGAAKDGGKETFNIFDETHLYILPEHKSMHKTVSRNTVKRKNAEPWSLETSTMYAIGQDSVAESTHEYFKKVQTGKIRDGGLLFDHREAPHVEDLDDDDSLLAALTYVYGDAATWMDLDRIAAQIREPDSDPADSRRYFLNQPSTASERYFDRAKWESLANREYQVPAKSRITLGFDGARWRDATAIVATEIATGFQWPIQIWEPPANRVAADDWETPAGEVDAAMAEAFGRYKVLRAYCDPPYWETTVASWAGKYGDKKVTEWWTHRPRQMSFALMAYRTAMNNGEISHDGDKTLAEHIGNAIRRDARCKDEDNKQMYTVAKDRQHSPRKIDAAMAGCLSWEARSDAIADGALRRGSTKMIVF